VLFNDRPNNFISILLEIYIYCVNKIIKDFKFLNKRVIIVYIAEFILLINYNLLHIISNENFIVFFSNLVRYTLFILNMKIFYNMVCPIENRQKISLWILKDTNFFPRDDIIFLVNLKNRNYSSRVKIISQFSVSNVTGISTSTNFYFDSNFWISVIKK